MKNFAIKYLIIFQFSLHYSVIRRKMTIPVVDWRRMENGSETSYELVYSPELGRSRQRDRQTDEVRNIQHS